MSVFDSIKGTFRGVQQDIREGLKALTSLDAQPRHDALKRLRADGVSLDAGADLLNKYQTTWKELQAYTTESAKRAEEVDSQISQVYMRWDRQSDLVSQLEVEVEELPALTTLIKKLTIDLGYIKEDFQVVEGALERLENVCEEQDYERNVKSHRAQLVIYKQKKMEEVQKFKVNIAKSHARTMQECDRQRQVQLKERHEAFEEAFTQDLDYYKTHGNIDQLKVSDIPIPKVSSLSDITIDDDQKVINDFLASADTTPSKDRGTDDIGVMSEGAFIEDDYTAEYNVQDDEDILDDEIGDMVHDTDSLELAEEDTHSKNDLEKSVSGDEDADGKSSSLPDITEESSSLPNPVTEINEEAKNDNADDSSKDASSPSPGVHSTQRNSSATKETEEITSEANSSDCNSEQNVTTDVEAQKTVDKSQVKAEESEKDSIPADQSDVTES